jgi:sigma-B regulation protein RsbU (phosphoserine phosphatase)
MQDVSLAYAPEFAAKASGSCNESGRHTYDDCWMDEETAMASLDETYLRPQLLERRERLRDALGHGPASEDLTHLLGEVDAALARLNGGTYGVCEGCQGQIEPDRLLSDPLARFCLDCLTPAERAELEHDLEAAGHLQRRLLPEQKMIRAGWEVAYSWAPAGPVGGDFCDLVPSNDPQGLFFLLGDVAGKGIAAGMLTAHLHATFRSLAEEGLAVAARVERANRLFRASALAPRFATLVCGLAVEGGGVELCNAGHLPPLLLSEGTVRPIESTGMPIGAFYSGRYDAVSLSLSFGDTLLLYTDGLTESRGGDGLEYSDDRLARVVSDAGGRKPRELIAAVLEDLGRHLAGAAATDDITVMAIRRTT